MIERAHNDDHAHSGQLPRVENAASGRDLIDQTNQDQRDELLRDLCCAAWPTLEAQNS